MINISIILLALALSADACVVSFSCGLMQKKFVVKKSILLGLFTGIFQGLMPILGFYVTGFIKDYIISYSHVIVFCIFLFLGLKIIKEAFSVKSQNYIINIDLKTLFLLGIATSIDAFASGVTLSLWNTNIITSALIIGMVTFINSIAGYWIGHCFKKFPLFLLEIFAGTLLIILGIKALLLQY